MRVDDQHHAQVRHIIDLISDYLLKISFLLKTQTETHWITEVLMAKAWNGSEGAVSEAHDSR